MDLTMHCELGRHQMRDHMMQETWWGIFSYLLIDAHPISSVGNGVACETTSQTYPCVQVYGLACHFELRGSRLWGVVIQRPVELVTRPIVHRSAACTAEAASCTAGRS